MTIKSFVKQNGKEVDFCIGNIMDAITAAAEDAECTVQRDCAERMLNECLEDLGRQTITADDAENAIRRVLDELPDGSRIWKSYMDYARRKALMKVKMRRRKKGDVTDQSLLLVDSDTCADLMKWDRCRIVEDIMSVQGMGRRKAKEIAKEVERKIIDGGFRNISTELIRSVVNEELAENGFDRMPDMAAYFISKDFIDTLLGSKSQENSNIKSNTPEAVNTAIAEYVIKKYSLDYIFSKEVKQAHESGAIHVHDLGFAATRVYCSAHSIEYIKKYGLKGLINLNTESAPAKSASVLTGHLNTYLASMQANYAGALGLAYINTLYAPYVVGMDEKQTLQIAQELIFNASQNAFSRGSQTIFTDFNIDAGVPSTLKDTMAIHPGGEYRAVVTDANGIKTAVRLIEEEWSSDGPSGYPLMRYYLDDGMMTPVREERYSEKTGFSYNPDYEEWCANHGVHILTYGDYEKESLALTSALLKVFEKGDANGKQFYFPKCQFHICQEVFDDPGKYKLYEQACQLSSANGSTYFVFDREAVTLSACCRLKTTISDTSILKHPERIRFCGFANNTVNLPHCAYVAFGKLKGERGNAIEPSELFDWFLDEVDKCMDLCLDAHLQKRKHIELMMSAPGFPLWQIGKTCNDGKPYVDLDKATYIIGLIGLNDAINFLFGHELHECGKWEEYGLRVIAHMYLRVKGYADKYNLKFSIEETPAESAARRLARADLLTFPDYATYIVQGSEGYEYYTNSIHLRADAPTSLVERIEKQSQYHPMIESGAIIHAFCGEETPDPKTIEYIVTETFLRTQCAQLTFSPTYTYCESCHTRIGGEMDRCPNCGSDSVFSVSRVVGYFSEIRSWNKSKQEEHRARKRGRYHVEMQDGE